MYHHHHHAVKKKNALWIMFFDFFLEGMVRILILLMILWTSFLSFFPFIWLLSASAPGHLVVINEEEFENWHFATDNGISRVTARISDDAFVVRGGRKQRGSKARSRAKKNLARVHKRIARQRGDYYFKLAKQLARRCREIAFRYKVLGFSFWFPTDITGFLKS